MMGKRLKEVFGLILINITLVSGSLNAETVYADTQAKIEIEKTEMPLKFVLMKKIKKRYFKQWQPGRKYIKIMSGINGNPTGQQASEEKVTGDPE